MLSRYKKFSSSGVMWYIKNKVLVTSYSRLGYVLQWDLIEEKLKNKKNKKIYMRSQMLSS